MSTTKKPKPQACAPTPRQCPYDKTCTCYRDLSEGCDGCATHAKFLADKERTRDRNSECWPAGYHLQENIRCCANCAFGGYIGGEVYDRFCICEVNGVTGDYSSIAKDPLGICDAFKWPQEVPREGRDGQ